jgi:hypothetical protein
MVLFAPDQIDGLLGVDDLVREDVDHAVHHLVDGRHGVFARVHQLP